MKGHLFVLKESTLMFLLKSALKYVKLGFTLKFILNHYISNVFVFSCVLKKSTCFNKLINIFKHT